MDRTTSPEAAGATETPPKAVKSYARYRQALFGIVSDLKRLQEIAYDLGAEALAAVIGEVLSHVEQQGFSVAVVGEFRRGKSTFINALLGKEILPSDVAPTSATISRVTYGLSPAVQLVYRPKEGQEERIEEIPIDQLSQYVTKLTPEAAAIAATIKEAIVYFPLAFCRNGVDLIDTPGLSDNPAMTRITLDVLPKIDAAIIVIMATVPFSQTEGDFLDRLLLEHGLGGFLFVVTALDRIRDPKDREVIVAEVTSRIKERIRNVADARFGPESKERRLFLARVGEPRVFGVSGIEALEAKLSRDPQRLAASRFPQLEDALERFLTEVSGVGALKTLAERISLFCREILGLLSARKADRSVRPSVVEETCAVVSALLDVLQQADSPELRALDGAVDQANETAQKALGSLAARLQRAGEEHLGSAAILPGHLEPAGYPQFQAWLYKTLLEVIDRECRAVSAQLDAEVKSHLAAEATRLLPFATAVDRILAHVRAELVRIDEPIDDRAAARSLVEALGARPGFSAEALPLAGGALWEGPGASDLAAGLTLPLDGADLLAVKLTAELPGGWLTRGISGVLRIATFKKACKTALAKVIVTQLQSLQLAHSAALRRHVQASFEPLRDAIERALREARDLLVEARGRKERMLVVGEREAERIGLAQAETEKIATRAKALATQLHEIEG
ncbi:MAG TPA: dynamin family protein [Thermoanaerobaculia bacterium]|jgi:hypothetical protein|nr:dynamin family protein [Thermoanaerobaculia bacterium]